MSSETLDEITELFLYRRSWKPDVVSFKSLFSEYSLCVDQIQLLRRIVAQLSYSQRSILRSEVKQSIMWDTKVGVWGSKFMLTSSHLLQCVLRQYNNNEMQV